MNVERRLRLVVAFIAMLCFQQSFGQKLTIHSPDKKIAVGLHSEGTDKQMLWHLKTSYNKGVRNAEVILEIGLGLERSD